MKLLFLAILLIAAVTATLHEEKFQSFKLSFNKSYKNKVEEAQRLAIFKNNLNSIEEHNILYEKGLVTYKQSINKFSDLTDEEFKTYLGTYSKQPSTALNISTHYATKGLKVPDSVDWRTQNQVTPVKNQGNIGSCWAFSIVGSVEAAYSRKSGNLVSLSESQIIDCSTDIDDKCFGDYLEIAYRYIQEYGLESEADYGYNSHGNCNYDPSKVITKIDGILRFGGEADMLQVVGNIGPVSVTIDATYLVSYGSGIFSNPNCTDSGLNHAVLVVGYGNENGIDFWIVKNSWGDAWGENGYFRILRGVNECGIGVDIVYPFIN